MKGIIDVSAGAKYVKSARGGKVLSAPRTTNTSYLELFTTQIDRSRLTQEKINLTKRRARIDGELARLQKRLDEIEAATLSASRRIWEREEMRASSSGGGQSPPAKRTNAPKPPSKNWRAMPMEY